MNNQYEGCDFMEQQELLIPSTVDGSVEPSLFYASPNKNRPLLVGLHTWSFDRFNQIKRMLPMAEKYDFNLLLPEFRGANKPKNPRCQQACGSPLAKQDVMDAVDYVLAHFDVDAENIFLLGYSGGGHMALLMAGLYPERFKAIGAGVPITDLRKWADQNQNYRPKVFACCGEEEAELLKRSPVNYLDTIAKANLKIFHGKYDPVVPVSHSLELYGMLMEKYPQSRTFLEIFDGGHQMDMKTAMYWFMSQYKEKEMDEVTG